MDQVNSTIIFQLNKRREESFRRVYHTTIIVEVLFIEIYANCPLDFAPLQRSLSTNDPLKDLANTINKSRSVTSWFEDTVNDSFVAMPP